MTNRMVKFIFTVWFIRYQLWKKL